MRDREKLRWHRRVGKRCAEGALQFAATGLVRLLDGLRRLGDAGVRFIKRRDLLGESFVDGRIGFARAQRGLDRDTTCGAALHGAHQHDHHEQADGEQQSCDI